MKSICCFLFFLCMVFCFHHAGAADDSDFKKEIELLKQRIVYLEEKVAELEKEKATVQCKDMTIEEFDKHLDAHLLHREEGYQLLGGLRVGLGATFIIQGTDNANGAGLSGNDEDVNDASYSVDIEFEKEFECSGKAFLHLETGDGAGVEDELAVFSNVNRDADDSGGNVAVTEIWYEQYFDAVTGVCTLGKIDPTAYIDTNEYANCECTQFLGRIFRNSPAIEFPDNAAGARFALFPSEDLEIEIAVLDADSDWEDTFDAVFAAAQLTFSPQTCGRPGNYRVYGWFNDAGHTDWNAAAKTKEENYGFGISVDQEISGSIGLFARYGWQNPDVFTDDPDSPGIDTGTDFSIEHAWSLGLAVNGTPWGRTDDVLALGFGQVIPSNDYKKAASVKAKSEEHLEMYYSCKINEHLTVTPDIQIIWDPFGGDATYGDKTIVVGGVRTQVDF